MKKQVTMMLTMAMITMSLVGACIDHRTEKSELEVAKSLHTDDGWNLVG
jgi:hypothetical protein